MKSFLGIEHEAAPISLCWQFCSRLCGKEGHLIVACVQAARPKLNHEFTEDMQREVTEFLFNHYRVHFMSRPALAQAYACIPQVAPTTAYACTMSAACFQLGAFS